ncbi:MAG: copper amine oxidase N-terminal domain-containing protein [Defluviitaleaceae bacterium]|nr:copper amine oxidase N-terminal domain-containing protein [Defluviitaleaceae bacterium]
MKKLKTLAVMLLAATMILAATNVAFAIAIIDEDGNIIENEVLPGGIMTLDADISFDWDIDYGFDFDFGDYVFNWPNFMSARGEVVELREAWDGAEIMRIAPNGESYIDFVIDGTSFVMGEKPEIGDTVTGFFDMNAPVPMIYPPQHTAILIDNRDDDLPRVIVDRFNDEWTSPSFRLNINENTEIILQDGTPFNGEIEELIGRKLAVEFTISHRDLPETIPNPERVTVLFERAVHPTIEIDWDIDWGAQEDIFIGELPGFPGEITAFPGDAWDSIHAHWESHGVFVGADWSNYDIIITLNGVSHGVPNASGLVVDSDLGWPSYLPLRSVTEMLGITPEWNDSPYRQVVVQSPRGEISLNIDSPYYSLRSHAADTVVYSIYTLAAPVIHEGRTYVPLAFFREIFGFTNVYFEGGHIQLNNLERME